MADDIVQDDTPHIRRIERGREGALNRATRPVDDPARRAPWTSQARGPQDQPMRLDARDVGGVPVRCRRRPPGPDLVDAEGFAASSTVTRATLGAASPVGVDELAYVAARLVEQLAAVPRGGHNRRVRVRAEHRASLPWTEPWHWSSLRRVGTGAGGGASGRGTGGGSLGGTG